MPCQGLTLERAEVDQRRGAGSGVAARAGPRRSAACLSRSSGGCSVTCVAVDVHDVERDAPHCPRSLHGEPAARRLVVVQDVQQVVVGPSMSTNSGSSALLPAP
jgi:hypothetical protein